MARNPDLFLLLIPVVLLAISGIGCNESGLRKVTLIGEVTYDGHKVVNGDIRFEPQLGTSGPVSSAPVVNGRYEAKYKGGVPVGSHRVVLQAFILEGIGPASGDAAGGDMLSGPARRKSSKPPIAVYWFEGRKQFLPPEFNKTSAMTITVTGEESSQVEDFNLESGKS